jgi:hypothetical protein
MSEHSPSKLKIHKPQNKPPIIPIKSKVNSWKMSEIDISPTLSINS